MGKYYGLINHTKHHQVSSYWKGSPPDVDEIKEIANDLKWDVKSDEIHTYSYEDEYKLECNEDGTKKWTKIIGDTYCYSLDVAYTNFGIKYEEQPDGSVERFIGTEWFSLLYFCC